MKRIILILIFLVKLFSFSNENVLIVNIIDLGDRLYSINPKIESSNYKLPFSKIIYNSSGKMQKINYKKNKNLSFKKIVSNEKYDYNKLKKLLEEMYNDDFFNAKVSIYCEKCSILDSDITILTEAPVQPKKAIVRIYEEILSNDKTGNLFINGIQIQSIGLLYQIEYRDIVLFLYEDGNYYESEKIKKFIDFINLSLNYIPQRKYMRDYIEKNR